MEIFLSISIILAPAMCQGLDNGDPKVNDCSWPQWVCSSSFCIFRHIRLDTFKTEHLRIPMQYPTTPPVLLISANVTIHPIVWEKILCYPWFISHPTANLSTVMEVKASKFSKLDPLLMTFLKPTCTTTTYLTLLPSPLNWSCSILTPAQVRVTYQPCMSSIMPLLKTSQRGTSQAVQWSRLCASTARSPGSIPGQGTNIPQATQPQWGDNIVILNKKKSQLLTLYHSLQDYTILSLSALYLSAFLLIQYSSATLVTFLSSFTYW